MDRKLLLLSANQIEWKLLSKSAAAGLLLGYVLIQGFSLWACAIFTVGVFALYLSESEGRVAVRNSLIILSLSAILLLRIVAGEIAGAWPEYVAVLGYIAIIAFFLSLLRFRFRDTVKVHGILNAVVLFLFVITLVALRSAPAFTSEPQLMFALGSFVLIIAFAIGAYMMLSESLIFSPVPFGARGRRMVVINGALAFLGAEILWITGFLPLGAINTAAFLTVFLILARDMVLANFAGKLDTRLMLREVVLFIAISLLLFASSPWDV